MLNRVLQTLAMFAAASAAHAHGDHASLPAVFTGAVNTLAGPVLIFCVLALLLWATRDR